MSLFDHDFDPSFTVPEQQAYSILQQVCFSFFYIDYFFKKKTIIIIYWKSQQELPISNQFVKFREKDWHFTLERGE